MALVYTASGAIFGGLALFAGWYGVTEGFSSQLFWYVWGMTAAGLLYAGYAMSLGVRQLAQLAWKCDAALRTLKRRWWDRLTRETGKRLTA